MRTNHVHAIVSGQAKPEKLMIDFKAWASRRLKEHFQESADRDRWTQHGSTLYLWNENELAQKIDYVLNGQGAPMAVFDGRVSEFEPEA